MIIPYHSAAVVSLVAEKEAKQQRYCSIGEKKAWLKQLWASLQTFIMRINQRSAQRRQSRHTEVGDDQAGNAM